MSNTIIPIGAPRLHALVQVSGDRPSVTSPRSLLSTPFSARFRYALSCTPPLALFLAAGSLFPSRGETQRALQSSSMCSAVVHDSDDDDDAGDDGIGGMEYDFGASSARRRGRGLVGEARCMGIRQRRLPSRALDHTRSFARVAGIMYTFFNSGLDGGARAAREISRQRRA